MAFRTVTRCIAAILVASTLGGCVVASAATPSASATVSPASSASPSVAARPSASPSTTPAPTVEPSPVPTPPNPSYCSVGDVETPNEGYENYASTYLDWTNRLPADYVPPDLVNVETGMPAGRSPLSVRAVAYADLARLRAAALAAGHRLVVVSAYRSYEVQAQTFDYWTSVGGYEQALLTSARPGHSEHQLGTAIDFGDGTAAPWEYTDWGQTPAGAWLALHAADFGFVMSYPKGQTAVTCYSYEPWHYRYVGTDLAKALVASGLPLREFQSINAPNL